MSPAPSRPATPATRTTLISPTTPTPFEAARGDVAVVDVAAEGFVPLLKLVEVATGAVLAEWEAEYSDDEALTYTIAGPGKYEARVCALEDGSGTYSLSVRVDR